MKRQRAKQRPLYRYDVYRGRRRGQARLIGAAGCAVPSAIAGRPYLRSRRSSDWVMSREIEIEISWMAPMMRSA